MFMALALAVEVRAIVIGTEPSAIIFRMLCMLYTLWAYTTARTDRMGQWVACGTARAPASQHKETHYHNHSDNAKKFDSAFHRYSPYNIVIPPLSGYNDKAFGSKRTG